VRVLCPSLRWMVKAAAFSVLGVAFGLSGQTPAAALSQTVSISNFNFSPSDVTINVGDSVTWSNSDRTTHTVTEDTRLWDSPDLKQFQTFTITITNPGTYRYHCTLHTFMRGTVTVKSIPAPSISQPNGGTLENFGPNLQWTNPSGAAQVQLQVIPAKNDGPGVDLMLGSPATNFQIPAPPQWYGLLPGMTYSWRVRTSDALLPVPPDHPSWSPWATGSFRTPLVTSDGISAANPPPGGAAGSRTPAVTWNGNRPDVFYYELQLSRDSGFNTDPNTAIASVYGALVHGGVTNPPNTYTVPADAPLDANTTYFWRVRPRVQGDGLPVAFSGAFSFRTP